jgi:GAF domain
MTSDRELDRFVDNLLRHEPLIDNPSHPAVIAITTGKPVVLDHITGDVLDAATDAPEQRRATGFLQGASAIVVPIVANREALGAMSLVRIGRPAQPFDSEEVSIAVDIAARAGEAFKRARTHQEVRDAFVSIQRVTGRPSPRRPSGAARPASTADARRATGPSRTHTRKAGDPQPPASRPPSPRGREWAITATPKRWPESAPNRARAKHAQAGTHAPLLGLRWWLRGSRSSRASPPAWGPRRAGPWERGRP